MSWSVTAKGSDKDELKAKMEEQQYMPEIVRNCIEDLIDGFPDRELTVASFGHHNNDELANVSIVIN